MKTYDEHTLKTYRRLRSAFRRAMAAEIRRGQGKASPELAKKACERITLRAVRLGWLELPKGAGTVHP